MSRHLVDIKMIRESFIALLMALIADSFAGMLLNRSIGVFNAIPGLLMILPALLDMRGNVYGAQISRLSSKLHLGEISGMKDKKVKINIISAIALAFTVSYIMIILTSGVFYFTKGIIIPVMIILTIILTNHFFTSSILTPVSAYIAVKSYEKKWNPDNIGVPIISAVGDFLVVFFMIFSALIVTWLPDILRYALLGVWVAYTLYVFFKTLKSHEGRRIYRESFIVLILVGLFELVTGTLWEDNKLPLLLLILPPFQETLGNIGSVLSARLSSFIYLGYIEPGIIPKGRRFLEDVVSTYVLAIIMASIVAALGFFYTMNFMVVVMIFVAGMLAATLLILISYYLTYLSIKLKMDPDNAVIPIITTLADIVGSGTMIFLYYIFF
ncbi:cation transporter [Aciduliprofundum sp. MAR08-339]|uniref:magnesium transporter n=1 Tax=Aciduliprofundum sp. (strain MAR08-339) TaxID=673860 RepID=UPI0002A4AF15|nr:cation transporter [Aciduliprofundum sp. MAR08-339]